MDQIFATSLRHFRTILRARYGLSKRAAGFFMPDLSHPTGDWRSVPNQSGWIDVEGEIVGRVVFIAHVRAK